ncbi:MAG: LytTR family DNA-binding domain-containing protein [Rubrivivax sp.]
MRAFVAEDEPPALERLRGALVRVAPLLQVVGWSDSVQGTQAWLAANPAPDLLLLDIQLADGLSLELFADGTLLLPTIFTTAYDRFALDAFRALAVDYLLKPVADDALARALAKAQRLRPGFGAEAAALLPGAARPRQRLLGRQGAAFHALPLDRVAYIVSVDKISFAVADDGARYALDEPLERLQAQLDPGQWFRATRALLVSLRAVRRFVPAGRGRLRVELQPAPIDEVCISPERAAAFRAWMRG